MFIYPRAAASNFCGVRASLTYSPSGFEQPFWLSSASRFAKMPFEHGLADEVVKAGQSILNQKDVAIGDVKEQFLDFIKEQNLSQVLTLNVDLFLTHPKNRVSLVLNPYNAHRNGSMIRRVGADFDELKGAVAVEMHPDPDVRKDCTYIHTCMNVYISYMKNVCF